MSASNTLGNSAFFNRLDRDVDGSGGQFIIKTKENEGGGNLTQKITINSYGAIGIGNPPVYGETGQVLSSNGQIML
jgi:hypothetical protein